MMFAKFSWGRWCVVVLKEESMDSIYVLLHYRDGRCTFRDGTGAFLETGKRKGQLFSMPHT